MQSPLTRSVCSIWGRACVACSQTAGSLTSTISNGLVHAIFLIWRQLVAVCSHESLSRERSASLLIRDLYAIGEPLFPRPIRSTNPFRHSNSLDAELHSPSVAVQIPCISSNTTLRRTELRCGAVVTIYFLSQCFRCIRHLVQWMMIRDQIRRVCRKPHALHWLYPALRHRYLCPSHSRCLFFGRSCL